VMVLSYLPTHQAMLAVAGILFVEIFGPIPGMGLVSD
jgi:hypothetical protein